MHPYVVWCLRKLQDIIFGWFWIFDIFDPYLRFLNLFCHSWHIIASENAKFDFNNHKIDDSFHVSLHLDMGMPKSWRNFKHWPKISKKLNLPKIISCNFLRHQSTYGCIWYAKQNPPYRGLSGKKDIWYSQHNVNFISWQSRITNLDSPCIIYNGSVPRY